MAVKVQLGALTGISDANGASNDQWCVEFSDNPVALRKLWGTVLALALRDRASSVHYHPWHKGGELSYVLSFSQYLMPQEIPAHLCRPMIAMARSLFTPSGWRRWCGRVLGTPSCGVVEVDAWGYYSVVWDVVVWSSGERASVELFRITPLFAVEQDAERAAKQRDSEPIATPDPVPPT